MKDPRVAAELAEGEQLVWTGKPMVWLLLKDAARGLPLVLALAGQGGCFLYWTLARVFFGGQTNGESNGIGIAVLMIAIAIPAGLSTLAGLALLLYPLIAYRNAKREVFALTSERCIVWYGSRVISYRASELAGMYRDMDSRGRGTLWLGVDPYDADEAEDPMLVGFCGIGRVREVEQMVRQTLGVPDEEPGGTAFSERSDQ
jgi:hypothetical protein